ncbi:hypothetical protein Taro_023414 [Colocasia esculenta]|uniref:Cytochrome b561 domain-containing protein n=1 Tax=Colocasia esculenta TaxID=4460 RepID=A0A843V3Q4_COLES|nr:hypothetical protein [Colocasia esculenta]
MVPSRGSRDFNTTLIAVLNILLFLLRPRSANSAREPAGTATGAGEDALKTSDKIGTIRPDKDDTGPSSLPCDQNHELNTAGDYPSAHIPYENPRPPPLVFRGLVDARRRAPYQNVRQSPMREKHETAVLLPCPSAASVILATVGAVHAAKNFENAFSNSHQRMGLALFALLCLQPFTGIFRPHRGAKGRTLWFFVHWFMGTGLCVLAIVTIYFGLHAYQVKTQRSTKIWTVLFTAEVSAIAFVYLLQDRWDYMQKQGRVQLRDHEQITSAEHHQLQVVVEAVKNVISNPIENPSCLIGF